MWILTWGVLIVEMRSQDLHLHKKERSIIFLNVPALFKDGYKGSYSTSHNWTSPPHPSLHLL